MSHEAQGESIAWVRPAALPGTEILRAERCGRLWRVFHENYVICNCISNVSVDWRYRGQTHFAQDGTLELMEPGETHVTTAVRKPADFKVLFISPAVLQEAARELGLSGTPHFRLAQSDRADVFETFARLHRSVEAGATVLEQQSRFATCIRLFLENYVERTHTPLTGRADRRAFERAKTYLRDRFSDSVTLEELGAAAGLSRFHLVRAFAAQFGLPPHAYQIGLRVERARTLLRSGVPPADVALAVGFADQSHLTRHFKRVNGVTPGRYARAS